MLGSSLESRMERQGTGLGCGHWQRGSQESSPETSCYSGTHTVTPCDGQQSQENSSVTLLPLPSHPRPHGKAIKYIPERPMTVLEFFFNEIV